MVAKYYPAIVESGDEPGYSVFFPDLPGCTSAGDTTQEAIIKAGDALRGHIAAMVRDGDPIPEPSELDQIERDPEVREAARALVRIDVPGRVVRPNISIDESLLERIDAAAADLGMSRSGFVAEAARRMLGT